MSPQVEHTEPAYRQIAGHIRGQIERGELQPGQTVPSVRQLAADWQISRATAERALALLRAEGLIVTQHGVGGIVQQPAAPLASSMARSALAAGALFVDDQDRVMLVRPTYKPYWDIPGGYVEPGESPYAACVREVAEELGIRPPIGDLLVVDWAPHPDDGDKLLFVFDGGRLDAAALDAIRLQETELSEYRYVGVDQVDELTVPRLARRLQSALPARRAARTVYLEGGTPVQASTS